MEQLEPQYAFSSANLSDH